MCYAQDNMNHIFMNFDTKYKYLRVRSFNGNFFDFITCNNRTRAWNNTLI